jgi:phage protein D
MTGATATPSSGLLEGYFCAPDFLVEVEGTALDPISKGDVIEVKVVMDIDAIASVDLKLNNRDDTGCAVKWSDSDRFQVGNRLHVQLGYADRLVSMLRGKITTLSPEFLSDGASTLTVRAMDGLVALKGSRPPEAEVTFANKADWEIARQIAGRHQLRLEHDSDMVHELVVQRNIDDLGFLKERAARIDCEVFMRTDPKTGKDVLHFARPADGRDAKRICGFALAWGSLSNPTARSNTAVPLRSMVEFKPTMTIVDQVRSVTVRGWDTTTKQPITHTATAGTTPGLRGRNSDATGPAAVGRLGVAESRNEVVVDAPVVSREEAQRLAESLLAERAYRFLTASAKAIGLPELRPGDNVEIHGVGERFGGMYYVTKATHTFNTSGLLTAFDVRKTYEGART